MCWVPRCCVLYVAVASQPFASIVLNESNESDDACGVLILYYFVALSHVRIHITYYYRNDIDEPLVYVLASCTIRDFRARLIAGRASLSV